MASVSKKEQEVIDILDEYGISYEYEKRFRQCRDNRSLPFDFYLEDYETVIEIDGIQHFESQKHFGGDDGLALQRKHDRIKTAYCIQNNIEIIRIPYYMDTRIGMKKIINRAIRESLNYKYYINTEGCYIISDYYNIVVCFKCDIEDPDTIDKTGKDLHIKYIEGDMKTLLQFCNDDVRYIIFERNDNGKLKYYQFDKIKRMVLRNK